MLDLGPQARHLVRQHGGNCISGTADPVHPFEGWFPLSSSVPKLPFPSVPPFSYPPSLSVRKWPPSPAIYIGGLTLRSAASFTGGVQGGAPAAKAFLAYLEPRKCVEWQPFWFVSMGNKMSVWSFWSKMGIRSHYITWGTYWHNGVIASVYMPPVASHMSGAMKSGVVRRNSFHCVTCRTDRRTHRT